MAKTKITSDLHPEIIEKYCNGYSCTQLAKDFKSSPHTISRILKENGITVTNRQNLISYTDEEVINDYCNLNLSLTQIAKNRHTTVKAVVRRLRKNNIAIINKQNETKFNENIFDYIDTEEKAYWLGFIYADGYIASIKKNQKPKYAFEICLKGDDVEHLHKFNKFIGHKKDNVKIGTVTVGGKVYTRCRWSIANKHLWETLYSLGCVPNKSLILKFPDKSIFKEEWLIIPFIRGYFDGDGCISLIKTKNVPSIIVSMLGTVDMLNPIKDLFFDHELVKNNDKNDKTYVYQLSQKQAHVFLTVIYHKANIYLERKYNKFEEWKNCRPKVKAFGLLEGKIGEGWDANPELTYDVNISK